MGICLLLYDSNVQPELRATNFVEERVPIDMERYICSWALIKFVWGIFR